PSRRDCPDIGEHRFAELEVPCQRTVMAVNDRFPAVRTVRLVGEDRRLGVLAASGDLPGKAVYRFFLVTGRPGANVVIIDARPGDLHWPVPCRVLDPFERG